MDVSSEVLWSALGLMLLIEGIFPFVSPSAWRQRMTQLLALHNGQIRFFGLLCVLVGLLILWWL